MSGSSKYRRMKLGRHSGCGCASSGSSTASAPPKKLLRDTWTSSTASRCGLRAAGAHFMIKWLDQNRTPNRHLNLRYKRLVKSNATLTLTLTQANGDDSGRAYRLKQQLCVCELWDSDSHGAAEEVRLRAAHAASHRPFLMLCTCFFDCVEINKGV